MQSSFLKESLMEAGGRLKKVRILLVPGGSGKVIQLIIPRLLMLLGILFLCSSIMFIPWFIQDYMTLSVQKPLLIHIEKERSEKQREFSDIRLRVEAISRQLQGLLELDRKLRIAANLEEPRADKSFLAMGGSDQRSSPTPGYVEQEREPNAQTVQSQMTPGKDDDIIRWQEGEQSRVSRGQPFTSFLIPGQHPVKGFIRSSFGFRAPSGGGAREFNEGIDISTRSKAPVVAPFDGLVTFFGWEGTQGWVLSLTHGHGLVTSYGQLEGIFVQEGQYVKKGEKIGMLGLGDQKGPYLHFEIRLNGLAVNPLLFISATSFRNFARLVS
jgi:murein DD-endopeptidase MepM/ murein hydrolase activator NlpD